MRTKPARPSGHGALRTPMELHTGWVLVKLTQTRSAFAPVDQVAAHGSHRLNGWTQVGSSSTAAVTP